MKTKLILLSVLSAFLLVASLAFTFTASAAIPHLMNYQGKATDRSGAPLNGTFNLTLRIYNSETGGTAKWSETQPNIPISNGIFQVQLGSFTPLNLPFDEAYWISIEINTDGEMTPRTRLASVPYAYKAESFADTPITPFYRKGFDIKCIDFNSIKITPGIMDVAGKMFTTTTYSNPLQFAYADSPANRDWVHGSKIPNSIAYVYAYNNSGQIAFKFSDESPNLFDQYGSVLVKPYEYRRYPDTINGLYYRCIGQLTLNNAGANPNLISSSDAILTSNHGSQFFTSSGTFIAPYGVTIVYITMCGGGGGGSNPQLVSTWGNGGGGAQFCIKHPYVVTPGNNYTVTLGSGGAGKAGGSSGSGADGTDSSFDTVLVLKAGLGNGAGGGNYKSSFKGGNGRLGTDTPPALGGLSLGYSGNGDSDGSGHVDSTYGNGGSGVWQSGQGGKGGDGICIVEW